MKSIDKLIDVLGFLAGVLLIALSILVICDVAARYFRLFSMPWSLDFAQYGLYLITFFGTPWVLKTNGHITIDLLVSKLSSENSRQLKIFSSYLGGLICAVLSVFSIIVLLRTFNDGTTVPDNFMFPEWWIYAFAPPTFLLSTFIFFRWAIRPQTVDDVKKSQGLF
jgi:TRAP-type C4-dicarboxylate transport system permease small subunit